MVAENLVQSPWKSRFGVFGALASSLPKPQLILKTFGIDVVVVVFVVCFVVIDFVVIVVIVFIKVFVSFLFL